jgi:DNA-binding transcriptional LysR family regulator
LVINLNLRQLRAFVALAQAANFTRAAERIHMTQAGLSLMVRDVETKLGCTLFERTTRSVRLTEAGRRLLPLAERTLRDFGDLSAELGKLSSTAERTVSIAATPLVASSVLPAALNEVARQHPDIEIRLKDADRRSIRPLVESGEVDLGLGILFEESSTIARELLARLPLVCVSARGRLAAERSKRGGIPWARLRKADLLALPPGNAIQQLVDRHLNLPAAPPGRTDFANLQTLIAMAELGRGAAILPSFVATACERYDVDVDPVESPTVRIEFFAISRKGVRLTPAAQPLLEVLKARLGG